MESAVDRRLTVPDLAMLLLRRPATKEFLATARDTHGRMAKRNPYNGPGAQ